MSELVKIWRPSPNFGSRRGNLKPEYVVLHYTAMNSCDEALDRLCEPEYEVSCHFLISETGRIFQLVAEANRAWHAGQGWWRGQCDMNSRSIGIELANSGHCPYPIRQMSTLVRLIREIMIKWKIPVQNVIGHSDMAIGRKLDPGRRFDWRLLAVSGVSIWPDKVTGSKFSWQQFLDRASRFGYTLPKHKNGKPAREHLLNAFRARFRPYHAGEPDEVDMALITGLAARIACRSNGAPAPD